jgi:26S proteasome non-ATPase regulatory subunit 10
VRFADACEAVSEGHGDAALYLLREGADSAKKDMDGRLAIDTAPDLKVRSIGLPNRR